MASPPSFLRRCAARKVGIKIACRALNHEEKEQKKLRHRIWRTDGKTIDEVNQIIRERMGR